MVQYEGKRWIDEEGQVDAEPVSNSIKGRLDRLGKMIQEARGAFEDLAGRIDPALRSEMPRINADKITSDTFTGEMKMEPSLIARQIGELHTELRMLTSTIRDTIDRVDI